MDPNVTRRVADLHRGGNRSVSQQFGKDAALLEIIAINGIGNPLVRVIAAAVNQNDAKQLLWVLNGERAQQEFVDQAEDRRVGSDADREREHGHGGEAGVFQQLAEGESQVIHSSLNR